MGLDLTTAVLLTNAASGTVSSTFNITAGNAANVIASGATFTLKVEVSTQDPNAGTVAWITHAILDQTSGPRVIEPGFRALRLTVTSGTVTSAQVASTPTPSVTVTKTIGDAGASAAYALTQGDYAQTKGDYAATQGAYAAAQGLAAQQAAFTAANLAASNATFISDTTANPGSVGPAGARGRKLATGGGYQWVVSNGSAWANDGDPLLTRGTTKEVLTSWYATVQDALASGAKTVWLDDDKTVTGTPDVTDGVEFKGRGGSLTYNGTPSDPESSCLRLTGVGARAEDIRIIIQSGAYTRGINHKASGTINRRCKITGTPTGLTSGTIFRAMFASGTSGAMLTGVESHDLEVSVTNVPRGIFVSAAYCPGIKIIRPWVHDCVTTEPNKLDWGVYLAQACDNALVDAPLIENNATIGGIHHNTNGTKTSGVRITKPVVRNVGYLGIALETYKDIVCENFTVENAALGIAVGGTSTDTNATISGTIRTLANTPSGSSLSLDKEMLNVNGSGSTVNVKLGTRGIAEKGALVNGTNNKIVLENVEADRPIILAQFNTTASGGKLEVPVVPDLEVALQTTTEPAVYFLAPDCELLPGGKIVHTHNTTTGGVVHVGATAHNTKIGATTLDGTGRPVRIVSGAQSVRVEDPRYGSRFSSTLLNDGGMNTLLRAPQVTADLGGPIIATGRFNINTTVAATSFYAQAVAVTGIVVTDLAVCAPQGDPGSLIWEAVVWTDGQVRVRLYNPTGAGIAVNRNFHYAIIRP